MKVNRGELLDAILARSGFRRRAKPGSTFLSKRELIHLHSWSSIVSERVHTLEVKLSALESKKGTPQ